MSHGAEVNSQNSSKDKGCKMSALQKLESLAGRIFYWGPRSDAGAPNVGEAAYESEHTAAWNEQSELTREHGFQGCQNRWVPPRLCSRAAALLCLLVHAYACG